MSTLPSVIAAVRRITPARVPHDDTVLGIQPDRTDVPLVPVPFAERTASPLWDSLTPKIACSRCLVRKPYTQYAALRHEPVLRALPYHICDDCEAQS